LKRLLALVLVLAVAMIVTVGIAPAGAQVATGHAPAAPSSASSTNVAYLTVYTRLAASSNGPYLYVPANSTAVLVYPTWIVTFVSDQSQPYTIVVDGLQIASASAIGVQTAEFNVTGSTATVQIGFAGSVYQYRDEQVATTTVQTAPPPPSAIYTAAQFASAILSIQAQVWVVVVLSFIGAFFMARKIVIINAKSHVRRIL
jgi:hypothetical protein